jgi:hypothetical protein
VNIIRFIVIPSEREKPCRIHDGKVYMDQTRLKSAQCCSRRADASPTPG